MSVDKATETSPLLRPDRPDEAGGSTGTSTSDSSDTAVEGSCEPLPEQNGGDAVTREGIPEMAKRLHILLPAIGIGIFLCALDQLLAVATVSIRFAPLDKTTASEAIEMNGVAFDIL